MIVMILVKGWQDCKMPPAVAGKFVRPQVAD